MRRVWHSTPFTRGAYESIDQFDLQPGHVAGLGFSIGRFCRNPRLNRADCRLIEVWATEWHPFADRVGAFSSFRTTSLPVGSPAAIRLTDGLSDSHDVYERAMGPAGR